VSEPSLVAETVGKLVERGGKPSEFKGMVSVTVAKSELVRAVGEAKRLGFEMLSDIFGIDYLSYPGHQGARFTVAYNLYSVTRNERLFIRVNVEDGETLPTITGLWKGSSFMEREVYDMFGVEFEGHPDLRKLITPEDLDGHPHRKDFPIGEVPTLFNNGRFIDPAAFRAGMSGQASGLSGWRGGARKGVSSQRVGGTEVKTEPELHKATGEGGQ
jgi:NADH-quinone oxidoreductase subunit C